MKIMKKLPFFLYLLITAACCSPLAVSATQSYASADVTNHIVTGDVNISIEEFEEKDGERNIYSGSKYVIPGDEISKIVTIKNQAADCWIRTKISFENDRGNIEGFTEENIIGISGDWKKIGDYYYYNNFLSSKSEAVLFTGVRIPEEWDNSHAGQNLQIKIEADAVQKEGFTPDLTSQDPWKGTTIETCIHETSDLSGNIHSRIQFQVVYQNGSSELFANPDDFFQNSTTFMPGTVYKDFSSLRNTSNQRIALYFSTSVPEQSSLQMDLLEKMQLSISLDDQMIYEGPLNAGTLKNPITLCELPPDSEKRLSYIVSTPEELNNTYADMNAAVKWIFSAKVIKESAVENENPSSIASSVRTGDDTLPVIWIGVLLYSAAAIILWFKFRRKQQ